MSLREIADPTNQGSAPARGPDELYRGRGLEMSSPENAHGQKSPDRGYPLLLEFAHIAESAMYAPPANTFIHLRL